MNNNTDDSHEVVKTLPKTQGGGTLACDPEKYREYLDGFDLSEEEQNELLKTLWTIMAGFVDLGFGVDSIQFLPNDDKQPRLTNGNGCNKELSDPKAAKQLGSSSYKGD